MNVGRFHFDEPVRIGDGYWCPTGGVFLILCRRNGTRLEPVHIGEVGGLRRKIGPQHRLWEKMHKVCKHPFVAFHPLPMCTNTQRKIRVQSVRGFLSFYHT